MGNVVRLKDERKKRKKQEEPKRSFDMRWIGLGITVIVLVGAFVLQGMMR